MKIIRAIVSGEDSPEELIKHWNKQMKVSREEALQSLKGNYKEENIFVLSQTLSSYDFHKSQMLECERRIEEVLQHLLMRVHRRTQDRDTSRSCARK